MSHNPHQVTKDFEAALCEYTGSKYAVAVNSCTAAIELAALFAAYDRVMIPHRTYIGVPMAIVRAGLTVEFSFDDWAGSYQLWPTNVWDCARRFTSGMYEPRTYQCVSFHASKILGLEQGGAILHDDDGADAWFRRARFDGRTEGVAPINDTFNMIGRHCYMNPSTAAQGLLKLHSLPRHNADLQNDPYPDLSQMEIFK